MMALQNRVRPDGEIFAVEARGAWMGNRGGALHDGNRRLGRRRWVTQSWIICRLEFKGRHRIVMQPGRYTELFFLDEATALAAGHRPCAECRRGDFNRFRGFWGEAVGHSREQVYAREIDRRLARERRVSGTSQARHRAAVGSLADGVFIELGNGAGLVRGGHVFPWMPYGYGPARQLADEVLVDLITPKTVCRMLALGYGAQIDTSAGSGGC